MSRKDIEECMACTNSDKLAIAELQHFLEMARTERGRSALTSSIAALQLEISVTICLKVDDKNLPTPVVSQNAVNENSGYVFSNSYLAISFTSLPSFLWDQNLDYVTFWFEFCFSIRIYLTEGLTGVQDLPSDAVQCDFQEESVDLRIIGLNHKNLRWFTSKRGSGMRSRALYKDRSRLL